MRSRYTAFTLGTSDAVDYLVATHHPEFRGDELRAGLVSSTESVDAWERLEVSESSESDDRGIVEFVATYRLGGELLELRERSHFVREAGHWFYTTGELE
jgi:SEC-C motif-containing protein